MADMRKPVVAPIGDQLRENAERRASVAEKEGLGPPSLTNLTERLRGQVGRAEQLADTVRAIHDRLCGARAAVPEQVADEPSGESALDEFRAQLAAREDAHHSLTTDLGVLGKAIGVE